MIVGDKVKVKYKGKELIGEVISIRGFGICKLFMIDCLLTDWLSKGDIVL